MAPRKEPPQIATRDARSRFAEILRKAEQEKERTRLTRRGKPVAYIVPLEDVERLKMLDQEEAGLGGGMDHFPGLAGLDESDDGPLLGLEEDLPPFTPPPGFMDDEPEPDFYPSLDINFDDDARISATDRFKHGLQRIFLSSDPLTPQEMAKRLKSDHYVGSTLRRLLGEKD